MVVCMILAGYAVIHGQLTLGGWIAVQSWVSTVFQPLNFLGSVYGAIYQAFIDIRNLSELLAQKPEVVDIDNARDLPLPYSSNTSHSIVHNTGSNRDSNVTSNNPMVVSTLGTLSPSLSSIGVSVEFRHITFHYAEQPPEKGLKSVDIVIPAGTTTALVGHTGSGKTTLSRLLFRFYDPLEGAVMINGYNIRDCTQESVRKCIGKSVCMFVCIHHQH